MPELVILEVQKYRAADGNLYDDVEDAERADREYLEDFQSRVIKEVENLARIGKKHIESKASSMNRNAEIGYYMILTLKNKYQDMHFLARNVDELALAYRSIFEKNYSLGFYHDDEKTELTAKIIQETSNSYAAVAFVRNRREYDYEGILEDRIRAFDKEFADV
jgi:hypothetical protein